MNICIEDQISCVKREISMRQRVYPKWVQSERMTQQKAESETNAMVAVLATLERVRVAESPQGGLF